MLSGCKVKPFLIQTDLVDTGYGKSLRIEFEASVTPLFGHPGQAKWQMMNVE